MNGLCIGDEKVNFEQNYINDSTTSGQETWSSSKIYTQLYAKADKASLPPLEERLNGLESTLASKANRSELGTQYNVSFNSSARRLLIQTR